MPELNLAVIAIAIAVAISLVHFRSNKCVMSILISGDSSKLAKMLFLRLDVC